ncbi:MAG: UDP-N-acetylmuramoyl-tripeptide--D-alanyl-D-alanine ligase [Halioglobus sp.]|nr:UDP-N-acetylmuramoyl-tripeptide--D-alanyl-D-alanine ligase [Halioglobus sp.]
MRSLSLAELCVPLAARLVGDDVMFDSVSTDSRAISRGDLFVALTGDNFDAHAFLPQVAQAGAGAALVAAGTATTLPTLQVEDTQRALGKLGAYNRGLFTGTLVAITGSNGKTTAKNMIHAVLSQAGSTLATDGNFNNEIGVPLTLLRLHPGVEYAVVEMGAAKAGDIRWLCELGRPAIGVLLNAMPAHLEGFGSVADVAAAKGEIFDDLGAADYAVINADQPFAKQWRRRAKEARVLDFGLEQPAAITARDIQTRGLQGVSFTASTPDGDIAMRLLLSGRHNVANALAATAVGLACGLSLIAIRDGLESLRPVEGRLRVLAGVAGAALIDDCYNANPGSVRAAIDTLVDCSGRRTLVLGAMRELGPDADKLHAEIGEYARAAGLDALVGVGAEVAAATDAFGAGARQFATREQAAAALAQELTADDILLIKGSRSSGMELVLHALSAQREAGEGMNTC